MKITQEKQFIMRRFLIKTLLRFIDFFVAFLSRHEAQPKWSRGMAETQVVCCATTARSKKSVFRRSRLTPPESIVPLIAAANVANATPQIFVAYVAPAAPAKSVGYPPHLFCCVTFIRKRPIAEAWPSLPQKIAASTSFLLRPLISAELRHGAKRSSES